METNKLTPTTVYKEVFKEAEIAIAEWNENDWYIGQHLEKIDDVFPLTRERIAELLLKFADKQNLLRGCQTTDNFINEFLNEQILP